jgi:hypothetical protein
MSVSRKGWNEVTFWLAAFDAADGALRVRIVLSFDVASLQEPGIK